MANDLGATTTLASVALTAFWGMVTVGRVLFAAIERAFPEQRTYHVLPFVAAIALGMIALLPTGSVGLGILAFGLPRLGCSALLPLTIGFGQEELVTMAAWSSGVPDRVLSDGLWHRGLRRRAAGTDDTGWTCAQFTCSWRFFLRPWPRCHSWSLRADPAASRPPARGSPPVSMSNPGGTHGSTPERASLVLLALILVAAVANLNLAVANVALPSIGLAFNASQTSLNLIAVGYSLGLAGSVLYFGALGDRYGRKMMLILGTALAIPFSVLAAFAPNENVLFIARVGGGLSAGMAYPDHARADYGIVVGWRPHQVDRVVVGYWRRHRRARPDVVGAGSGALPVGIGVSHHPSAGGGCSRHGSEAGSGARERRHGAG